MVLNHSNKFELRDCDTKVVLPQLKTDNLKRSFTFRARMNWKNLPNEIRKIKSITNFKNKLDVYCLEVDSPNRLD